MPNQADATVGDVENRLTERGDLGDRADEHMGRSLVTPKFILTLHGCASPRQFPLEVLWDLQRNPEPKDHASYCGGRIGKTRPRFPGAMGRRATLSIAAHVSTPSQPTQERKLPQYIFLVEFGSQTGRRSAPNIPCKPASRGPALLTASHPPFSKIGGCGSGPGDREPVR